MSRTSAGIGAGVGSMLGGMLGTAAGGSPAYKRMTGLSSSEAMTTGGLIGALVGSVAGAAIGAGSSAPKLPPSTGVGSLGAETGATFTTPAQASGHPNFVTDWPVQGPTDPGIRAADCRFAQTLPTPQNAPCVDCKGPIPMGLLGNEQRISFGGRGSLGFALEKAGDPDVWDKLSPSQQTWLANVKQKLNDLIVQTTGTKCATWGPDVTFTGATKCFQAWYNSYGNNLRTDGVLDQDTLSAFIETAQAHQTDFPQFPGQAAPGTAPETVAAAAISPEKKLSTGAMFGIGAAGLAALGGIAYVATRGGKSRRRRK